MIIKKINLKNFRSHDEYELEADGLTTLILGENGWGKTSVLEAIYIALQGKSFRAVDREILKRDAEFYVILIKLMNGEEVRVSFDGVNKNFLIDGKKWKRLPRKNRYPVILFLPSDLNLISASPGRRRDYFDALISQRDEKYARAVSKYKKALKQRNELLKRENVEIFEVFPWNVMLAEYGWEIFETRKKEIEKINEKITESYRSIAENSDTVSIFYKTDIKSKDEYLKILENDFLRDKILKHTSFGVQKDDFIFQFNGREAEGSASRGEVRSIILALKFIEADEIEEEMNKKALILLDDVFSELDEKRQRALISNFSDNQIIITSTSKPEI
ncbi:DNA replication/repair protein RecF [Candidatus Saccharibacteria bacterium]|nr:DNA replication/repair protein RecF [Candidatus Saccharibacteria bacterium]